MGGVKKSETQAFKRDKMILMTSASITKNKILHHVSYFSLLFNNGLMAPLLLVCPTR